MQYRVELARRAVRDLERLPSVIRTRVANALDGLEGDPRPKGKHVKALHGTRGSFLRYRVGDYRLIYEVMDDEHIVLVSGIVHRSELDERIRRFR